MAQTSAKYKPRPKLLRLRAARRLAMGRLVLLVWCLAAARCGLALPGSGAIGGGDALESSVTAWSGAGQVVGPMGGDEPPEGGSARSRGEAAASAGDAGVRAAAQKATQNALADVAERKAAALAWEAAHGSSPELKPFVAGGGYVLPQHPRLVVCMLGSLAVLCACISWHGLDRGALGAAG